MLRGRPPKDEGAKTNRVPMQHGFVNVTDKPYKPSAALAKCPVKDAPPETVAWWKAISTMPHCVLWAPADWEFAKASALVHAGFIRSAGMKGETALREREKVMGATRDARQSQRLRYQETAAEEPAKAGETTKPVPIDRARRERLTRMAE